MIHTPLTPHFQVSSYMTATMLTSGTLEQILSNDKAMLAMCLSWEEQV